MADKRIYELPAAASVATDVYLAVDSSTGGTKKVLVGDLLNKAGGVATIKTATLSVGATSVTFTQIPTTGTYSFELYSTLAGLDYNEIDDTTSGELTYTFDAQESAVTLYLIMKEVA